MAEFAAAFWRASRDQAANQGATLSEAYVDQVQTSLDEAIAALQREAARRAKVEVHFVKGHLAEVWHAETLKVAASAKGRSDIWANAVGNNKTGQDVQYGDPTTAHNAELKYYKTGEDTARQHCWIQPATRSAPCIVCSYYPRKGHPASTANLN